MNRLDGHVLGRAGAILARIRANARGVEVGVCRGRLSRQLLMHHKTLWLAMVDLWSPYPPDGRYAGSGDLIASMSASQWKECYHQSVWLTEFAEERRQIIKSSSVEAAAQFADRSLDFVFLDADHSYEGVREDINAWLPKISPRGWIGGHDFANLQFPHWGVTKAVEEFSEQIGQPIEKDIDYTWFIHKSPRHPRPPMSRVWRQFGPTLWAEFHGWTQTADLNQVNEWLGLFSRKIPCGKCRRHWLRIVKEHPPDVTDRAALFAWTVRAHNLVNRKLGKDKFSQQAAIERWQISESPATDQAAKVSPARKKRPKHRSKANGRRVRAPAESTIEPIARLPVDCRHATATASATRVTCSLGLYGGHPHLAMCADCPKRSPIDPQRIQRPVVQVPSLLKTYTDRKHLIDSQRQIPSRIATASPKDDKREQLLLRSFLSPGDILMLTAAVRDLHRAYPGQFQTYVETSASDLWENNPLVSRSAPTGGHCRVLNMHYPLVNQSNQRPVHFLQGYAEFLASQLDLTIPITEFHGDVHLAPEERAWTNQVQERFRYSGRFWIIMAGGKYDFTTKWWPTTYYQEVVNHFLGRIQFVQCGESGHWHPPLTGVFNLVGQTSLRQFIRLMYHADGVICPVTFAMHLSAAVPTQSRRLRPCVVVAGGREPPHWESYPGHHFLHTIGCLPCCATGGCWKSRCQRVNDGDRKDVENLCDRPTQIESNLVVPQCMALVRPAEVIQAIEKTITYAEN